MWQVFKCGCLPALEKNQYHSTDYQHFSPHCLKFICSYRPHTMQTVPHKIWYMDLAITYSMTTVLTCSSVKVCTTNLESMYIINCQYKFLSPTPYIQHKMAGQMKQNIGMKKLNTLG